MWYWILYAFLAVFVLLDAKKRKNNFIGWSIGTFVAGPVVLPIYFAKRYLKAKEVRTGGTAWNVLKNFALFWTLLMFVAIIAGIVNAGNTASEMTSDAEKVGAAIGTGLGITLLIAIWFFPMVFAFILGFFLKNSGHVVTGPTGKLANSATVSISN
jgi:hypothetical protein